MKRGREGKDRAGPQRHQLPKIGSVREASCQEEEKEKDENGQVDGNIPPEETDRLAQATELR